ncbi:TonB-dependent receptor [Echinimonas agarilytica]|uniref:TonB-dependent receptor n=1 Tax=Echinimonas agarilytica TaxID=1215918 RepID=A0AA42B699_9GAMM|nr:TonB-dependent receptor [Echinimonas agarilytica]MCM2678547.1 TonB-dependent receptor [Echinimonas agarilytica]
MNTQYFSTLNFNSTQLKTSKIAIALGLALSLPTYSVLAQESETSSQVNDVETIQVTGIRGSLLRSMDTKRSTLAVSDAISAEDIGKFPDTNIAESLQRITGVSIDRSGGEGQFITVRGFGPQFNTVLVNGRIMATENDGREFSFDVISSDIINGAQVFKSPTANMQEGGIGATVNLTTARPFDYDGLVVAGSVEGTYDTLDEDYSPGGSVIVSHSNSDRTLGALASISYSDRSSLREGVTTEGWNNYAETTAYMTDTQEFVTLKDVHIPGSYRIRQVEENRERLNAAVAVQWVPVENVELTLDGLYSDYDVESVTSAFQPFFGSGDFIWVNPVLDENNTMIAFERPGSVLANAVDGIDGTQKNDNIYNENGRPTDTWAVGFNVDWQVNEKFDVAFDLSHSKAESDPGGKPFLSKGYESVENAYFELGSGDLPSYDAGVSTTDPSLVKSHFVGRFGSDIEDEVTEFRIDSNYEFDNAGPLSSMKFGVYAGDREKSRVAYESYLCAYCGYFSDFNDELLSPVDASGFADDASGDFPKHWFKYDVDATLAWLESEDGITAGGQNDAETIQTIRDGLEASNGFAEVPNDQAGYSVKEEVVSAYLDTYFSGDMGELPWEFNVGMRLTRTKTISKGINQEILGVENVVGDSLQQLILSDPMPVKYTHEYTNILPSANFRLDLQDDLIMRLGYSETITRPTMTSLAPSTSINPRVGSEAISGGNPNLEAFESTNYDMTLEWYFSDVSLLAAALFHKEIENFVSTTTRDTEIAGITFKDSRPNNQEEATATGIELAFTHSWDNGFGTQLNYTYVDSSADYSLDNTTDTQFAIEGLSPNSYNIIGFYEKDAISVRLAYNWRDEFLKAISDGSAKGNPITREDYGQLDLSASYELSENLSLYAEGINVLEEDIREYTNYQNRLTSYEYTGARYTVGIRGKL